ncbi:response regulator transcription factor [bacterium]|nr:response regulator transcription factor [bacterium]MBP9808852.1 response regulator transcription factor [bacterium]
MAKILFVEDDKDLTEMVKDWLSADGYSVEIVHDGTEGWEVLRKGKFDLIILDWHLPGGLSGPEICRRYRDAKGKAPVIMLTGRTEITEKEQGFDAGVDDYLTKPFNLKELSARLRALLRRPPNKLSNTIANGAIEIDLVKRIVTKSGAKVQLQAKEFDLLEYFMLRPDEELSTEALLQRLSKPGFEATAESLLETITGLRKKLDDSQDQSLSIITTIPQVGYSLRKVSVC